MSGVSISTISLHHPPSHVPLHVSDTPIGAIRRRSIRLAYSPLVFVRNDAAIFLYSRSGIQTGVMPAKLFNSFHWTR